MLHLLERRSEKGGQAFPPRLPNDAQASTIFQGHLDRRIVRKSFQNFRERMVQCQVASGQRAFSCVHPDRWTRLLQVNELLSDRPDIPFPASRPVKYLSGIERFLKVEFRSRNRLQTHPLTLDVRRSVFN